METYAKVICDSVSPLGCRLTTVEVQFPRFILPQLLMTRMWSRSCESLRARPVKSKLIEVGDSPVVPVFAENRKGMTAGDELSEGLQNEARSLWLGAMEECVRAAERLSQLGVAKQWANRLLEPFAYQKAVITATDWGNFFLLRCADDAQPEIQELAVKMRDAIGKSEPRKVTAGNYHRPYFDRGEWDDIRYCEIRSGDDSDDANRVSLARCARVSFTAHDGTRRLDKDLELAQRLIEDRHTNPCEHVATPAPDQRRYANFRGWVSYRYQLEQEGVLPNPED